MNAATFKEGDVVSTWFDTGAMGSQLLYWRVVKVCKVLLRVEGERGGQKLLHPGDVARRLDPVKDKSLIEEVNPSWVK